MAPEHPGPEPVIKPVHPPRPGLIEGRQGGFTQVLQDEVPLEESKPPLDLPLGPRPVGVDGPNPQPAHVLFEVGQAPWVGRLELAPPVTENGPGQAVAHEGPVEA